MNRSPEEIERDVEATRSELDRTVEALKEKITPGQIVDELMGSLRGGSGGEMISNLQTQVRDNPLPLALIGAGIAWLMFGKGPSAQRTYAAAGYSPAIGEGYDPTLGGGYEFEDGGSSSGRFGVKDKVSDAASTVADKARGGVASLGSAASSAKSSVTGAASRAADGARGAGAKVSEKASGAASALRNQATSAGQSVKRTYANTLEQDPLIIAGLGLAVGAALGAAFPATAAERRYVGPVRDKVVQRGREMANERLQDAKSVANAAYETVREEADRQGISPEAGTGLIDKAVQVARSGIDAAKQEVEQRRPH